MDIHNFFFIPCDLLSTQLLGINVQLISSEKTVKISIISNQLSFLFMLAAL